jgi:actin-related protein
MKTEDHPQEGELALLGRYSPHEASKLLARFERAAIEFRAHPLRAGYGGSNGPTVSIDISVDPTRSAEVDQIHHDLFGDSLPNYESSFFRGQRNV